MERSYFSADYHPTEIAEVSTLGLGKQSSGNVVVSKNKEFCAAIFCGDTKLVRRLIADETAFPTSDRNLSFKRAIQTNQVEIMKILLAPGCVDPASDNGIVLANAATNGTAEMLRLLLQDGRAHRGFESALLHAAKYGKTEAVKILLASQCVSAVGLKCTLRFAEEGGHAGVARVVRGYM